VGAAAAAYHRSMADLPSTAPPALDERSIGAAAALLQFDTTAPWGRDADGRPLARTEFVERFCRIDVVDGREVATLLMPPNNGAVEGTRVRYSDLAAFSRDFGSLGITLIGGLDPVVAGLGGGTFSQRSLPPTAATATDLWVIEPVAGSVLPEGWTIEVGRSLPFYGGAGGAHYCGVFDGGGAPVPFDDPRLTTTGILTAERYDPGA